MTTEQKAKAYDELLIKAKQIYNKENDVLIMHTIEDLLPELAESEDEKIRKTLIDFFQDWHKNRSHCWGISVPEILVWLEKQGEQKPIMNVPSREVILSIWDLGNEWKELTNGSISTEYGTQLNYIQKHWHESEYYLREKQGEQKSQRMISAEAKEAMYGKTADKVEPKFKVKYAGSEYNVLDVKDIAGVTYYVIEDEPNNIDYVKANSCEIINVYSIKGNGSPYPTKPAIFAEHKSSDEAMKEALRTEYEKGRADAFAQMQKEWSEEDDNCLSTIIAEFSKCAGKSVSRDEWMRCNDFLNSLKNRVPPQPKQEWSEEDEVKINRIVACLENLNVADNDILLKDVDWLKSLKDRVKSQNTWKPSDGQMSALKIATHCPDLGLSRVLKTLYNDLDKLTKE